MIDAASARERAPRRRGALVALLAGGLASAVLAFGFTPTLAAFTASIQNTIDSAGAGALTMKETNSDGTVTCNSTDGGNVSTNSATCATINKYGGNLTMVPGQTVTSTITISDTGSIAASSFALTPGTCTQSANGTVNGTATDLCAKMNLKVTSGSTVIYDGNLADFTTPVNVLSKLGTASVAAGASIPFSFAVTLDATAGNTYAGLKATQPLTWTFGA